MYASATSPRPRESWLPELTATAKPLLYGIRLWVSVCLALYLSFWLQLDNPSWAAVTAAIVCQPQLGASLRKGWFRMIGTVIGSAMIVALTGLFPQDRIAYLGLLALWCAICAFGATVLRNFASYSAALAGYTAALIAADTLGATGGASPDVFLLAVDRATEICVGIVCAGVVLAGTDLGGAQRTLAVSFADLTTAIISRFTRMPELVGAQLPDTQAERRELVRRVIALDPVIDETIGESSHIRYHSPTLQAANRGLLSALNGWRGVATHLNQLTDEIGRQGARAILRSIPSALKAAEQPDAPARWMADPVALHDACEDGARSLLALPATTPSLRLLADETAKVLSGIALALRGLALLVDAPGRAGAEHRRFKLNVPDLLPAVLNAVRAFLTIVAFEVFWIVTAWPSGAGTIVFAAVMILLLSPRGDLAYSAAVALGFGAAGAIVAAAILKFAVLPTLETFPAFCIAIGFYLVPIGFAVVRSKNPAVVAIFSTMSFLLFPVLAPTNQMSYDTAQFYNSALSILAACIVAPLAFRLLPPLSPALRARRLAELALRDLRRVAVAPVSPISKEWEDRMYSRIAALPDEAEPSQRGQLLAALSVGTGIIHLRDQLPQLGTAATLFDAAIAAFEQGNITLIIAQLREFDNRLAAASDVEADSGTILRARGQVMIIAEAIANNTAYFTGESVT